MRKRIYLAIIEKLKELKDEHGAAKIKHFDLWNMNVEFIELETAFDMPAVFIEFEPIAWKTLGNGVQQADVAIKLHVVTRYEGASADGSQFQAEALAYFDLLDEIHKKLFGLKGEGFNALKRVHSATNHNHEEIIESIEVYSTMVIDR